MQVAMNYFHCIAILMTKDVCCSWLALGWGSPDVYTHQGALLPVELAFSALPPDGQQAHNSP